MAAAPFVHTEVGLRNRGGYPEAAVLRGIDVVSRHGGDEFIVVLPELATDEGSVPVAEKLIAAVSEPVELEGQTLTVTPSIGISIFPRDGDTAEVGSAIWRMLVSAPDLVSAAPWRPSQAIAYASAPAL